MYLSSVVYYVIVTLKLFTLRQTSCLSKLYVCLLKLGLKAIIMSHYFNKVANTLLAHYLLIAFKTSMLVHTFIQALRSFCKKELCA